MHIATYAHVIDGMQGRRFGGFDELIETARAELEFRQGSVTLSEAP